MSLPAEYEQIGAGPWSLCIYQADGSSEGGKWFRSGLATQREGEIPLREAETLAHQAMLQKLEVRVLELDGTLVFWAAGGRVLHGPKFWIEVSV